MIDMLDRHEFEPTAESRLEPELRIIDNASVPLQSGELELDRLFAVAFIQSRERWQRITHRAICRCIADEEGCSPGKVKSGLMISQ
ncbi:MAG TPA: hypothetical protein VEK37_11055 [Gemmatimonadaceae bacterium]|nr:hypothetical protein [Gemmatimonadaceae bacterium]